jgi:hypothetical protein
MSEEQDARWRQIIDARADFGDETDAVIPLHDAGRQDTPRRRSSKTAEFDEALSGFSSWSSVEPRRRRLSA